MSTKMVRMDEWLHGLVKVEAGVRGVSLQEFVAVACQVALGEPEREPGEYEVPESYESVGSTEPRVRFSPVEKAVKLAESKGKGFRAFPKPSRK